MTENNDDPLPLFSPELIKFRDDLEPFLAANPYSSVEEELEVPEQEAEGLGTDAARRFLYLYRILEYASFLYLENEVRSGLRRILTSPHALDNLTPVLERIAAVTQNAKMDEYARFAAVIRENVDTDLLWKEVAHNKAAFCEATSFDGGVSIAALISSSTTCEDFRARGHELVTRSFRDIRNALSHGRDQRTSAVITPSARNLKLLQPWVNLITVAAGEVVLYKDAS